MSSYCVRCGLLLCILVLALCAGTLRAGEIIGDQEGVRRFGLSSGLEVVVVPMDRGMRQQQADSELQIWLVVRAGTMDEPEAQHGVAYIAERVARQGVAGFDREAIDELLTPPSADERPYPASGSIVTLDQTVFMGHADAGDPESVRTLLGFYAALLDPQSWSLTHDSIGRAQQEAIERFSGMDRPEMRARQRWLPELLGGEGLGLHARFPEADELRSLGRDEIKSFVDRGYRASRSTLIVMGDTSRLDLKGLIAGSLGTLDRRGRGEINDLRDKLGGSRFVMGLDPEMESHQVALVWVSADDEACLEPWGVCASRFDEAMLRETVLHRVALELLRNRLERLLVASLGGDIEVSVNGMELAGQIDLLQCVIEGDGVSEDDWSRSLRSLVGESDRLALGRVGSDEIARARGSLLARWHREAVDWETMGNEERMWLVHWLVTSGRPVLDAKSWDRYATGVMSSISDAQVNQQLRAMLKSDHARVLAVSRGEPSEAVAMSERVREVVSDVRASAPEPIDPDWMRTLGGALLDDDRFDGSIEQVTQHAASGAWGARLGNGVSVWARRVGDDGDERVELSAMLSGAMFSDGTLSEPQIEAALLAWRSPSSESRDSGWLALYCESRNIEVHARRVVGGVRLRVAAPAPEFEGAIELLYLLLDRPMIDAGVFEQWNRTHTSEALEPLERALALLYNPAYAAANADHKATLDDAQRALSRMVRNATITVGIAGVIDAGDTIERAGTILGKLAAREVSVIDDELHIESTPGDRVCEIELQGREAQRISGTLCGSLESLDSLRATILASMVLHDRVRSLVKQGGLEADVDAQVVMSDSLGDRWAFLMRVGGPDDAAAIRLMNEAADEMMSDGIAQDDLDRIKSGLDRSLARYTQSARYWSTRLSGVGLHGRTLDDVWSVRSGYARIDAETATDALRAALGGGDRFVIRMNSAPDR